MARFERGGKVFEITSQDSRYAHEVRKHLREGWTRVADPRCEVPLGAEPRNPTLEAALYEDPDDIGAKLVYADWLQQQGHPRGALIAVQHRLASSPADPELVAEERRLIQYGGDSLLSKVLAAQLSVCRDGFEIMSGGNHIYTAGTLDFDHGFLRRAQLHLSRFSGDEDIVWELLRHPSSRALVELEIDLDRTRDTDLVATLLMHGPQLPLRSLVLSSATPNTSIGLQRTGVVYPRLESLRVVANHARFGDAVLPHLEKLVLDTTDSDFALAAANMLAIERLSIATPDPTKLVPAFDQLPQLRHLTLTKGGGLALCRTLAFAKVGARLESLDLRNIDGAVDFFLENRARFAKLAALTITGVSPTVAARLREAGYPLQQAAEERR